MNGYIIEAYNNMGNAYTCKRLVQEAAKQNIRLDIIGIHDTCITEDGIYNAGQRLEHRDILINRYKWGNIKDCLNGLADYVYNKNDLFRIYINKFEQLERIDSDAFLKPKYILSTACADYDRLVRALGKRIVAKGLENSMGKEIFLIDNKDDFKALQKYGTQKEWLFEEFIAASSGRDVRVYSIRGEVTACMMRQSKDDFRANVALGGKVTLYEVTDDIRKIASDIYVQTGLDYVGIDLLFGTERFYFCEINVMPGLEGIETATGVNVAKKMMDMIRGDVKS